MQQFVQNAKPDIFRESRCFKIVNKHYLDYITKQKSSVFIKKFVRRFEQHLQKKFPTLNVSLSVNRRHTFFYTDIEYPLISAKFPYKLISSIENFERENLDELFRFIFPKSFIRRTGNMITSFLREKIIKRKDKADIEFSNNSDRKFSGNISFGICFGCSVLLVTIDIKDFESRQQRLLPLDW